MGIRLERGPGLNIMCTWKIWGRWTVMDFGKHTNYIWILTPRGTVGMLYVQPTFFVCVNKNSDGIAHPPVLPLKDHTENNRYYIWVPRKDIKAAILQVVSALISPQFYFSQPLLYFKMFPRAASVFVLALPLLASATALPRNDGGSQCNSGSTECCNTSQSVTMSIIWIEQVY